jgi:hypothetical protein
MNAYAAFAVNTQLDSLLRDAAARRDAARDAVAHGRPGRLGRFVAALGSTVNEAIDDAAETALLLPRVSGYPYRTGA